MNNVKESILIVVDSPTLRVKNVNSHI